MLLKAIKKGVAPGRPLAWISGSVLYARDLGDPWAIFRVPTISYAERARDDQAQVFHDDRDFARQVGRDFSVLRTHRQWDPAAYVADMDRWNTQDAHSETREAYVRAQADELSDAQAPALYTAEVWVCVSLRDPQRAVTDTLGSLLADPGELWSKWRRGAGDLGLSRRGLLSAERLERDHAAASELLGRLLPFLPDAVPASVAEIERLVRSGYCRGLGEPRIDGEDEPEAVVVERNGKAVLAVQDLTMQRWTDPLHRRARMLQVESELGTSWQVGLVATKLGPAQPAPSRGLELLFRPQDDLDFPLSLALNCRWVSNTSVAADVEKRITRVDEDAQNEWESPRGISEETDRDTLTARSARSYTKAGDAWFEAQLTAIAYADDPALARRRAGRVREIFDRSGVRMRVAAGQQLQVFFNQMPGQRGWLGSGYNRKLTPAQVGAMGMRAGHQVGDRRGYMIGRTLTSCPSPVRWSPMEGPRTDRPSGVLMVGNLGSGKTTLMAKICLEAYLDGWRVFDITHKRDDRTWHLKLPAEHRQEINLTEDPARWRGLVDPWLCAPKNLRLEAVNDLLLSLLPEGCSAEWQAIVARAVTRTDERCQAEGVQPTNTEVLATLEAMADPQAETIFGLLADHAHRGLAQLAFADADAAQRLKEVGDRQVTVVVADGLPLAKSGAQKLSRSERIGEALVRCLALMAAGVMDRFPDQPKLFNYDEARVLLANDLGRKTIEEMQLQGRSKMAMPVLGLQMASHIGDRESVANIFGSYFLLAAPDAKLGAQALQLADLEPTPERVEWLRGFGSTSEDVEETDFAQAAQRRRMLAERKGRCLLVDHAGRAEFIKLVIPDELLTQVELANPRERARRRSNGDAVKG